MLRGRLFSALSSLLLLLILAGIPTSEAVQCLRGGTCYYRNLTEDFVMASSDPEFGIQECPDACYDFGCFVNGNLISGNGCEADLRANCPDISEANIAKLKEKKKITWVVADDDSYRVFACKAGDCKHDLLDIDRKLAVIEDPAERALVEAKLNKSHPVEATIPCEYKAGHNPSRFLPTKVFFCPRGGHCSYYNPIEDMLQISYPRNLTRGRCFDACYSFQCVVDGKLKEGLGCEDDLRAICPSFTEADMSKLKEHKNMTWVAGDTYRAFACKAGDCEEMMFKPFKALAALDSAEIADAVIEMAKKFDNITVQEPCEYKDIPKPSRHRGRPSTARKIHREGPKKLKVG